MKTAAVICEYNPLHYGHMHHLEEIRKAGITHIIALLSDDFVQRGDTALLPKSDRSELALQAGADLVLELPVPFSCASAELYAGKAVRLLHDLGVVDYLSFGCSGSAGKLEYLAEVSESLADSPEVQKFIREGYSYPSAIFRTVSGTAEPETAELLSDANNLLALEYLKAIRKYHAEFKPLMIQRTAVRHDSDKISGKFASAGYIRKKFFSQEDYTEYVPEFTARKLAERQNQGSTAEFSRLAPVILYRTRMMTVSDWQNLPDMNANLAGRFRNAETACTLEELLFSVKSKCFTMARIRRILLYALLHIRKEDMQYKIPYARILAFNRRGAEILKQIRNHIPAGTSLAELRKTSPEAERFVQMQIHSAGLYGLAQKQVHSAESEFRRKITITKNI